MRLLILLIFFLGKDSLGQLSPFNKFIERDSSWFDNYTFHSEDKSTVRKLKFYTENTPPKQLLDFENLEVLDLSNNQLDKIPKAVFKLKSLRALDLSQNKLKDLSPELSNLKNLEILILDHNYFEKIPLVLANLPSLKCVHIINSHNLTEVQKSLEFLSSIQSLVELRFVGFKGEMTSIPCQISALKNLKYLHIDGINLKTIPKCLGALSSLEHLYFGTTNFLRTPNSSISEFPVELCNLTNLETLFCEDLAFNRFPNEIRKLSKLKNLHLVLTKKFDTISSNLGQLNVQSLVLSMNYTYTHNSIPKFVCHLDSLSSLFILSNLNVSILPEEIGNLKNLEVLIIGTNTIDNLPNTFCDLKSLKSFTMIGCELYELPDCINDLPSLDIIDLGKCSNMTKLNISSQKKFKYLNISLKLSKGDKELDEPSFDWSLHKF